VGSQINGFSNQSAAKHALRQPTSFTCCARDHSVGSRARPLRAKDALRPPASGPALAGSGRRSGHIFACDEDATSKNVKVKPALCDMTMKAIYPILIMFVLCFWPATADKNADRERIAKIGQIIQKPKIEQNLECMALRQERLLGKKIRNPELIKEYVRRVFYVERVYSSITNNFLNNFNESHIENILKIPMKTPFLARTDSNNSQTRCNSQGIPGIQISPERRSLLVKLYYIMQRDELDRQVLKINGHKHSLVIRKYLVLDGFKIPDNADERAAQRDEKYLRESLDNSQRQVLPDKILESFASEFTYLTDAEIENLAGYYKQSYMQYYFRLLNGGFIVGMGMNLDAILYQ
jgi:hypothetical protein